MSFSVALSRISPKWRDLSLNLPAWGWLLLIAAPLRLINLGQEPLWYDELFQIWWAHQSLPDMLTILRGDVHPPGWYLIEWVTVRLIGDSQYALRLPAAILGLIAVWLTWRLALALRFDRPTAFLAGVLAAIMPGLLYYSQDARMYPLLTCAVLLAALAAVRGSWPIFAVAGIVAVYSQNLGWFYILLIGLVFAAYQLALVVKEWRAVGGGFGKWPSWGDVWPQGLRGPVLAAVAIGCAYLPWLPSLLHQVSLVREGYWIQPLTFGAFIFPYAKMIVGWRLSEILQAHAYSATLAMTIVALIVSRRWLLTRRGAILLAVALGTPILIGLISWLWRSVYLDRAMLPAMVALMPLWAYGLMNLSLPNRRSAWIILAPMLAIGVVAQYFPVSPRNDITPSLDIASQWQPGDILYLMQTDGLATTHYYLPDKAYALMPEATTIGQSLSAETRQAMHFNELTIDQVAAQGYKRAWFMYAREPMISQAELDYLDEISTYPFLGMKFYGNDPYNRVYVYLVKLQ